MIRMEAMIRHENHGSVIARFIEQRSQHLIVELVRHRYHVVVQLKVAFADPTLPRRMILHEPVAEMIDRFVVDRKKIPWLIFHEPHRGRLHAHAFRQRLQETRQTLVIILIDLCRQRNKRFHHFRR